MKRILTFRHIVFLAFACAIIISVLIGASSLYGIRIITSTQSKLIHEYYSELIDTERLRIFSEETVASGRGYLITGDPVFVERTKMRWQKFQDVLTQLEDIEDADVGRRLLYKVRITAEAHYNLINSLFNSERQHPNRLSLVTAFENKVQPARIKLDAALSEFNEFKKNDLELMTAETEKTTRLARYILNSIVFTSIILLLLVLPFIGKALIKYYNDAQAATKLRDDFVAIVSHDLKNPLGSMMMAVEIAADNLNSKENHELKNILRIAHKSGERMNELISQILNISKIESGTLIHEFKDCDLKGLVENVFTDHKYASSEKNINVSLTVLGDVNIKCDCSRISQVIANLVSNAIKFSPVNSLVEVTLAEKDSNVVLSVSDQGPGISENEIRHIFDRYWQASKTKKLGTGLGLSIAKSVVVAHKGKIAVESSLGKGSTFVVTLPKNPYH